MNNKYLFLFKIKPYKCEKCGIDNWLNETITLEVHHIDGDHNNNDVSNLQLLCPNCHSQTKNYCRTKINSKITDEKILELVSSSSSIRELLLKAGLSTSGSNYNRIRKLLNSHNIIKFNKKSYENYCIDCGKPICLNATRCELCEKTNKNKQSKILERDILKQEIRNKSFVQIGKENGVTDNAVRKWCKKYKLPYTKKEINNYTDEEWLLI